MSVKIAVVGAAGRMGQAILRLAQATPGLEVVARVDRAGGEGILGDLCEGLTRARPQVVIDFTSAEASAKNAESCAQNKVAVVIGSTGMDAAQKDRIKAAAKTVPIVLAPNMSVGVNVLFKIAEDVTRALGADYEVDILEAHHRLKKDAPSGTAIRLAEAVQAARDGKAPLRHAREGLIGERPRDEVGMAVLRGGDVVGEHTVFFFGEGERIELTHRATSRDQFARGALRAAQWIVGRPNGLYDMQDVLGLRG